ncbi:hypothetical protein PVAND_017612 [Polypedilum vanderplanki]|uniref:Uncharacterized protein n=1 Tax=Polypedilum vanderplanki TaxID=319348 RepID=A0A9J6B8V5_POLVA|nr:hypothetical protein PVAND_017612 [Polypedilum vanderplanki]
MQCAKCFEGSEKGELFKCNGHLCTKKLHLSCANKVSVETGFVFYYCINHFQEYTESAKKANIKKQSLSNTNKEYARKNHNNNFSYDKVGPSQEQNVDMRRRNPRRNDLNVPLTLNENNDHGNTMVDGPPSPYRHANKNEFFPEYEPNIDRANLNDHNREQENNVSQNVNGNIFQRIATNFRQFIGLSGMNNANEADNENVCHECEKEIISKPFNCRYCLLRVHQDCIDQKVLWSVYYKGANFTCLECRNKLNNFNRTRNNVFISHDFNRNRLRQSTGDSNNNYSQIFSPNRSRIRADSPLANYSQPIQIEINGQKLPVNNEYIMSERMINQTLPLVTDTERTWRIFYQTYKSSKGLFNDASNIVRITKAIQCQAIKDIGGENLYELNHYDEAIEDINKRLQGTEQLTLDLRKKIYAIEQPENNDHECILKAIDTVKNFYNLICKEHKDEYLYDANLCVDIISRMPSRVYNRLSNLRLRAKKANKPYFIADIMPELEFALEDSKHKLDMERIVKRHIQNRKKVEKSYKTERDEETEKIYSTSVIKKQFRCWLHDNDSHSPNKCRNLWMMSGLEARKLAIEKGRCITCGLNKHNNDICPYSKALKCNLANCDENHHAMFCSKRPKRISKKSYIIDSHDDDLAFLQEVNEYVHEESGSEEVKTVSIETLEESTIKEDHFYFRNSHLTETKTNSASISVKCQRRNNKDNANNKLVASNTRRLEKAITGLLLFIINCCDLAKEKIINTIHHTINKKEQYLNVVADNIYKKTSSNSQLPVVVTKIWTPYGLKKGVFLLDSGSTTSLINTKFANNLLAKGIKSNLTVKGINSKRVDNKSRIIQLKLARPDNENHFTKVAFHTYNELDIAGQIFEPNEYYKRYKYLKSLNLLGFKKADGLIGIDNIHVFDWTIVKYKKMEPHYPLGIRTIIGDTLIGSEEQTNIMYEEGLKLNKNEEEFIKINPENVIKNSFMSKSYSINCKKAINDMEKNINNEFITDLSDYEEDYLRLEELTYLQNSYQFNIDSRENYFEHVAKKMLTEETIKLDNSNHYKSPILWKDRDNVVLPSEKSYKNAMRRFLIIEKYGKANKEFHEYEAEVKNLLDKGYAVEMSEQDANTYSRFTYYVPIFFINPPNKRRRIIFDFKAKVNGISFNENIIGSLNLLNRIDKILFDSRKEKYLIKGDIKEMFLQIKLYDEDSDSMRFLFRFKDDTEIKTYKMKVLPFGCASSPTISQFVKNKIAEEEDNVLVKNALIEHTYMDDTITSVKNPETAINLVCDLKRALKRGGFNLLKINTNCSKVNEYLKILLKDEDQEKLFTEGNVERLLGYEFDLTNDTISINFSLETLPKNIYKNLKHPTKRNVLQVMNALFDPLGLFGYATAKMKIVYKRVCETTQKWDDYIDSKLISAWEICLKYYNETNQIKIPRWNTPKLYDKLELLIFCDASKEMICTIAYILATNENTQEFTLSILTSKSHTVNNRREYSIPELELEAANQAVKLSQYINKMHEYKFHDISYFSDSKITIDEIKMTKREKFTIYTENRIKFIKQHSTPNQWYWIPTEIQAADAGTKIEVKLVELRNETEKINNDKKLTNRDKRYNLKTLDVKIKEIESFLYDESHWFNIAETHWLRYAQNEDDEIKELINYLKSGKKVPIKNRYYNLQPYIDIDGLVRLRTRIADKLEQIYSLDYDKLRPILLPHNNGITDLIVLEIHEKQAHMLIKTTANQIRAKYHIHQLETTIRKIIKENCHYCRRFSGKAQKPIMGDIPIETFGCFESSFIKTTADVFGPIMVKPTTYSKQIVKRYGLVVMCLMTRATHIEVLNDLTTESHIKAFEIIFAIRGTPRIIYTDLHASFLDTNKTLQQLTEEWNIILLKEGVIRKSIKWETKAAYMSWNQGVVERQIGEIKKMLKNFSRLLNMKNPLTDYELRYLFIKILNVLNNTPITCFEDHKQIPQLTPAHFLMLRENTQSHPKTNITSTDLSVTWINMQKIINNFWEEWLKSYFPKYLNRRKWNNKVKPLEVNSIVLCAEKGIVDSWRIGRIIAVDFGSNDQVRSVTIRLGKNKRIEKEHLKSKAMILDKYKKEKAQIVTRPAMLVIELNIKTTNSIN